MPVYQFHCPACDIRYEKSTRMKDRLKEKCPECGEKVEIELVPVAFHLKGTGWYVTDYARKEKPHAK